MQIRRRPPNPSVQVQDLTYQIAAPDAQPRNILEAIVWHKEQEVNQQRAQRSLEDLKRQVLSAPPVRDFRAALQQHATRPSLIAEVKKASPSQGVIRVEFDPVVIAQAYERGGAACLSVLTDQKFFQGSFEFLQAIRQSVSLPLLCKEFILYPYQLYLARVSGADAVLLIAAILSDQDLRYCLKIAKSLGMQVLVEVHNLAELDRVLALPGLELVGINNRNLENFTVNLGTTHHLATARQEQLCSLDVTVVSESGLHTAADLALVAEAGARAVLIGESLVKQPDPEQAVRSLLSPDSAAPRLA